MFNRSVKHYIPTLDQPWADSVTIHSLLNNTSGINSIDKPLAFSPGKKFQYSNLNYILLAQVLEVSTGMKYEKLVNELFKECRMNNSFYPTTANEKDIVNGLEHSANGKKEVSKIDVPGSFVPAMGIVSTANDLVKWNELLHNGHLLTKPTYHKMISYSIQDKHSVFGSQAIGYGYGIRINDINGTLEYGHTGIVPSLGFTSLNLYFPKSRTSVIVLENQAFNNFDIAYYFETAIRKIIRKHLEQ